MSFADLTQSMSSIVFGALGEPVTVMREDMPSLTVTGLFKAEHEAVDVRSGVSVSSVQPVLELRACDVPGGVDEGDAVQVQGCRYQVTDVRPDGHGTLKLLLHKLGARHGDD